MAEERRFVVSNPHLKVVVEPERICTEPTPIPDGAIEGDVGLSAWPAFVTREDRREFEAIGRYVRPQQDPAPTRVNVALQKESPMEMTLTLRPKSAKLKRKREADDENGVERDGFENKKQKNDEKPASDVEKLIHEAWMAVLPHTVAILRLLQIDETVGDFKRFIADWLQTQDWAADLGKVKESWRLSLEGNGTPSVATFYTLLRHLERIWTIIRHHARDRQTTSNYEDEEEEEEEVRFFSDLLRTTKWIELGYDFGYERNQVVLAQKNLTAALETKNIIYFGKPCRDWATDILSATGSDKEAAQLTVSGLEDGTRAADIVREFDDKKAALDELRWWIVWKEKFMAATIDEFAGLLEPEQTDLLETRFKEFLAASNYHSVIIEGQDDYERCGVAMRQIETERRRVDRPYPPMN